MPLKFKKAKDHADTGNWLVVDEDGTVVAKVYYDAQHLGWYEDLPETKHYGQDWLGFNKVEVLERLEARVRGNPAKRVQKRAIVVAVGTREAVAWFREFLAAGDLKHTVSEYYDGNQSWIIGFDVPRDKYDAALAFTKKSAQEAGHGLQVLL